MMMMMTTTKKKKEHAVDDTPPTHHTKNLARSDSKAETTAASTASAPAAATSRTRSTPAAAAAAAAAVAAAPFPEPKFKRRTTTTTTTKPPSLVKLLKRRDFSTIRRLLLDSTVNVNSSWFSRSYTMMGENCLHYLLRFRPDSRTVSAMIYRLHSCGIQEPELSVDLTGRTPLHVAVLHGCDVSVIDTLLKANAGRVSTRAQDFNGRVPLHYAVMMSTTSPSTTNMNSAFGSSPRHSNVGNEGRKQTARRPFLSLPFMMKIRNINDEQLYKKERMYNTMYTIKFLLGMSPETCLIMDDYHQLPIDIIDTFLHSLETSTSTSTNSMKRLERGWGGGGRGRISSIWKKRLSTDHIDNNDVLHEQDDLQKKIVSMIGDELRMSHELYTGTSPPCRRIGNRLSEERCCCCCNRNNNKNKIVHEQPLHQPVVDPKLSMDIVVFTSADSAGGFENDDDISVLSTRF